MSRQAPDAAELARRLAAIDEGLSRAEQAAINLNMLETHVRTQRGLIEAVQRALSHERDALLEHQRS